MNADTTSIYIYYALIIVGELLIVTVLVYMLYKRRSPASIISWILSMILLPYISAIAYFIFGSRKRKNRYKKDNIKLQKHETNYERENLFSDLLRSHGIPDASENEKFELYTDPKEAYDAFIYCIEEAKESIYISTYIFSYDNVTKNIIDALAKKAKSGVDVKILIDSLGSIELYLSQYRIKELVDSGAKIEFFMPIFQMPFRNYINLRNHRKIYIFDKKIVLSGGMNISSEYLNPEPNKSKFEDIMFLIKGSSVELFFELFASDWLYASKEKLDLENKIAYKGGETFAQVVPSGPDMPKDTLYETLLCAIYGAKERIWIITPYFIPDNSLMQALIIAKHKGLDIKLITPVRSDSLVTDITRNSYMRELQEVGAEVSLYNGRMLHAKAILFDNSSVMLGSVNIDNRSLFLNYEVATFIYSNIVINDIELWINKLLKTSDIGVKKASRPKKVLENLMRILAPQL